MTRATILYGASEYVVARAAAEVRADIEALLDDGGGWLSVNHGRGQLQPAQLRIDRGIPVAVVDSTTPE
jgi:hypothetical protein